MKFFFFNDTATTEIYTLSLHDALPIFDTARYLGVARNCAGNFRRHSGRSCDPQEDRKSTRLNSSHGYISYAVFCLKKKKTDDQTLRSTHCPHTVSTINYQVQHYTPVHV